ncbi:MAG: hypothetical protein AB7G93_23480 [Bdellovibrionales bacterium]
MPRGLILSLSISFLVLCSLFAFNELFAAPDLESAFRSKGSPGRESKVELTNAGLVKELRRQVELAKGAKIKNEKLRPEEGRAVSGFVALSNGEICKVSASEIEAPPVPGEKPEAQVGVTLNCRR